MDKRLKNCYYYLNLPFTATEEDVRIRETAMHRIFKTKEKNNGKSYKKKINRVTSSANLIIENLKANGMPNVKSHWFEISNESLFVLLAILCFVGMICVISFWVLQ